MSPTFLLQALRGRAHYFMVWLAGLIGLNLILLSAYFSSDVIRAIKTPLFELSTSGILLKIIEALFAPIIGLLGAVAGFYFGPPKMNNKNIKQPADETIERSAWVALLPTVKALIILITHVIFGIIIFLFSYTLNYTIFLLSPGSDFMVVGAFPVHHIVDILNWAVLAIFIGFGVVEAVRALWDS